MLAAWPSKIEKLSEPRRKQILASLLNPVSQELHTNNKYNMIIMIVLTIVHLSYLTTFMIKMV